MTSPWWNVSSVVSGQWFDRVAPRGGLPPGETRYAVRQALLQVFSN
ncbi:hypothetical protein [Lysobacter sp. 1R34A]